MFNEGPQQVYIIVDGVKHEFNPTREGVQAAILLAKATGDADTIHLENVVPCGGTSSNVVHHGMLADLGLLKKTYHSGGDIKWRVIGNIVMTDTYGKVMCKGDIDVWSK